MSEAVVGLISAVVTAVITGGLSLLGVYISNRKSASLIAYRLEQLEQKVQKHNNLVERMYSVEGRVTEAEHDIKDLKNRRTPA